MGVRVLILCLISIDASVVLNGESAISKGHVDVVGDLESVQRNIQQPHSPMEAQNLRSALVSLRGVLEHLLTCNCCGKDRCACGRGGRRKEGWRPSEEKHSRSGYGDKPPIHFGSTTQSLREDERAYSPVEDLDAFITPIKKTEHEAEEHEVEEDEHSSHVDEDERVVIVEHEAEEDERERPPLVVPPDLDEHSNREDEREGDLDENEDDRESDADEAETSCSIHKDRSGCCEVEGCKFAAPGWDDENPCMSSEDFQTRVLDSGGIEDTENRCLENER